METRTAPTARPETSLAQLPRNVSGYLPGLDPIALAAGGTDTTWDAAIQELRRRPDTPDQQLVSNLLQLTKQLTPETASCSRAAPLFEALAQRANVEEIEACCIALLNSPSPEIRGAMLAALTGATPAGPRLLEAVCSTIHAGETSQNLERAISILPTPLKPAVIGQILQAAEPRNYFDR